MASVLDDQMYKYLMSNAPVPDATPAPTAAPTPAPVAAPSSPQQEEAPIAINGFNPSKISLLTKLGDFFTGNRFHMEEHIRQHDMQRALEGYDHDPRAAILRVMKIPGMATKAISMLNTVDDNQESETRGKLLEERLKDQRLGTIRRLMNGADEKTYPKLREYAQNVWNKYQYDDELPLPPTYDKDIVDHFARGDMTVDQQTDNFARDRYNGARIELSKFRAQNSANYQRERIKIAQEGLGVTKDNSQERVRHDRAMEDKLPAPTKANPTPGREGMVQYDPTGKYAKKFMGGKWYYFEKGSDGHHYLIKGQDGFDQEDDNDEDDN